MAGTDSVPLAEDTTSFSYTIPEQYGTCKFKITYQSVITDWDDYVGEAKKYTNSVTGPGGWTIDTSISNEHPHVAGMYKSFVMQSDDWAQWQTQIFAPLKSGDTYIDTTSNISLHYFTQEELDAITLTINNIPIDPALYEISPNSEAENGKYKSFKITFKGNVVLSSSDDSLKPSKTTPLVISYKTKVNNPYAYGAVPHMYDYYNYATLETDKINDTDEDFCRRVMPSR